MSKPKTPFQRLDDLVWHHPFWIGEHQGEQWFYTQYVMARPTETLTEWFEAYNLKPEVGEYRMGERAAVKFSDEAKSLDKVMDKLGTDRTVVEPETWGGETLTIRRGAVRTESWRRADGVRVGLNARYMACLYFDLLSKGGQWEQAIDQPLAPVVYVLDGEVSGVIMPIRVAA